MSNAKWAPKWQTLTYKECRMCNTPKPKTEYWVKNTPTGKTPQPYCKPCQKSQVRTHNRNKSVWPHLKHLAGGCTKVCNDCVERKSYTDFHVNQDTIDGLDIYCKDCRYERVSTWQQENRELVSAYTSAWAKRNPEKSRRLCQRRRARMHDAFVEPVNDLEIFERDDWTCQICNKPVNPELSNVGVKHPMWKERPTIDHIVSLARGGTHEPSNVQTAHLKCNAMKNDNPILKVEV